jgi:hypothetical protein
MSRPLGIEFAKAFHPVMARGNARMPIFVDDDELRSLLDGATAAWREGVRGANS